MKSVGGLPNPRGSLGSSIPTQTIAEANEEVQKAVGTMDGGKNVVLTSSTALLYVPKFLSIYACQHGAAAITLCYSGETVKREHREWVNM